MILTEIIWKNADKNNYKKMNFNNHETMKFDEIYKLIIILFQIKKYH